MTSIKSNSGKSPGPAGGLDSSASMNDGQPAIGFAADLLVLDGENAVDLERLRLKLRIQFDVEDPLGDFLVDRLALLLWRLRRVPSFETSLLSWIAHQQAQIHDQDGIAIANHFFSIDPRSLPPTGTSARFLAQQHHGRNSVGRTIETAFSKSDPLGKIGRYESHLMRQVERVILTLRQFKARPTVRTDE